MITETHSKINTIIEAAGDTINTVVQSICNPLVPAWSGYTFNPLWLSLFPSLVDLNVVTPTGNDYLSTSEEFPDRYPFAAVFIDQVVNNNETDAEETYTASLGVIVGVERESFATAQIELFEIQTAIRSIFMSDKPLGYIHRGNLKPTPGVPALTGTGFFDGGFLYGTGTLFTTEVVAGDWIALDNEIQKFAVVDSITNNTKIVLEEPYRGNNKKVSGLTKVRYVRRGGVIDVNRWQRFQDLTQPEQDENAEGIFLMMTSFYQIWYTEDWIGIGLQTLGES